MEIFPKDWFTLKTAGNQYVFLFIDPIKIFFCYPTSADFGCDRKKWILAR